MTKHLLASLTLALLLLSPTPASALGLYEGYALAEGHITAKGTPASSVIPDNYCTLSYTVTIDGAEYSNQTEGFSDFCHLEAEDSVKIKYLVSDPRKNSVASEFEINNISESGTAAGLFGTFGALPIFIALIPIVLVIAVIITTLRSRKQTDTDGDGLAGDAKPATAEQKKLIEEGFRRLGVHHTVKKKLTQAQARETLREINQKLHHK